MLNTLEKIEKIVHTSKLHPILDGALSRTDIGRLTKKELEVAHELLNKLINLIRSKNPSLPDGLTRDTHIPEFSLMITPESLEYIKKAKGWETYAEMAKNLGITKARMSQIKKDGKLSIQLAGMITYCMGNIGGKWWLPFTLKIVGYHRFNSPKWNHKKFNSEIPYGRNSTSAEFRSLDKNVEQIGA